MREFVARNMNSWFEKINKRNVLHLVGCLHRCFWSFATPAGRLLSKMQYISVFIALAEKRHVACSDTFSSRNMRRQVHIKPKITVSLASLLCYFYVPSTPGVTPLKIFRVIFLKVSTRAGRVMGGKKKKKKKKKKKSPAMILCVVWRLYPDVSNTLVVPSSSGLSSIGLSSVN